MMLASTRWGDPKTPTLVCLHGVRGHGLRFESVGERLGERLHVVAYDLRGHGRSGWDPPWDLPAHCSDVADSVASLDRPPVAWLAHSFGARILLELAADGQDLGDTAILLDPALGITPKFAGRLAEADCRQPLVDSAEQAARARVEQGAALLGAADLVADQLAAQMDPIPGGGFRLRYSPAAVVSAWSEMSKPEPTLAGLPARTLVVLATESIVPPELASQLGSQVTVRRVKGGHNVLWDAPEETIDLIQGWMET